MTLTTRDCPPTASSGAPVVLSLVQHAVQKYSSYIGGGTTVSLSVPEECAAAETCDPPAREMGIGKAELTVSSTNDWIISTPDGSVSLGLAIMTYSGVVSVFFLVTAAIPH